MNVEHHWSRRQSTALLPLFLLACAAWLTGCATSSSRSEVFVVEPPKPYMRIHHPDTNTVALQVSVRKLKPPQRKAPVILLVAASHIGDSNYYAAIQRCLDQSELVLFEGIGGRPVKPPPGKANDETLSLQSSLAKSLGLVFQLEAVDYDRPHFKNSDVQLRQIQGMMTSSDEKTSNVSRGMQDLVDTMQGTSFLGMLLHTGVKLIAFSPRLQATFKLVFIETLGQLKGDLAQAKGLPPEMKELMDFIIKERNQIVLRDLQNTMNQQKAPRTIAIFYGAGHMHDLEKRIVESLHYKAVDDQWMTAFSVNTAAAGLTETELGMVRSMVRWQMRQLMGEN